jgi:phage tail-like protein
MARGYPPVAFHFKVEVDGASADSDIRFTEVGGLAAELTTEEVPEGGENRFVQKYPLRTKYPELVLKRGLVTSKDAKLIEWVERCVQGFAIEPRDVHVKLLDAEHQPLVTWHFVRAYPTKWAIGDLNASSNSFAVESMQLFYQTFSVTRS